MSKFSDLIQKKHEMMKVTMKVDPAACKNGEITHFKEYVGFVLAEKEFEKTYEKLLKKYTLQNEGFFDAVGGTLKAFGTRLYKDVTEPFKDPFKVGQSVKELPKSEADSIINEILNNWLCENINKKISFVDQNGKSYNTISLGQFPGQTCIQKTKVSDKTSETKTAQKTPEGSATPQQTTQQQNQKQTSRAQQQKSQKSQQAQQSRQQTTQSAQQRPQQPKQQAQQTQQGQNTPESYDIGSLILYTDFNNQLNVASVKQYFTENATKIIEERKKESADYRKKSPEIKINDVIKHLEYVVKNNLSRQQQSKQSPKKYTWVYMLAKDGQTLKVNHP